MGKRRTQAITFKQWISEQGPNKLSELLDVQVTTVRHWRTGHCLPQVDKMRAIKKLTKGMIGYEQIIDGVPAGVTK